ncbi:hypothetical protein AYK24_00465 [Thermoplasmatales archaeon SG8-52-4]|nr:MAG: hypothetical protein AYK24_00465 [Thermoplasmatales archaeon SG8-52-4]
MRTNFRNLKISNKLLDLNIPDEIFKEAEDVYKKHKTNKLENEFAYCIFQQKYILKTRLSKPPYGNDDKVVGLQERCGKEDDNGRWFETAETRFSFVPTITDIKAINYIKLNMRVWAKPRGIFDNMDDYKYAIIDYIRTHDTLSNTGYGTINPHIYTDIEKVKGFVQHLNWLYDTDIDTTGFVSKKIDALNSKFKDFSWQIHNFFRVKDIDNNRRLAVVIKFGAKRQYHYGYGRSYDDLQWCAYDIPHENPAYNYVDEGTFAAQFEDHIPGKIQFDNSVKSIPKSFDPLEYYIGRKKDQVFVFNQDMIDKANKKYMIKQAMDRDNKLKKEQVAIKINTRIKNIDKDPLKLNETVFSGNKIEYAGQVLESPNVDIKELLTKMHRYHDLDDINYDRAFEMFISELIGNTMHEYNKDISARIGDINIVLHQKRGTNKTGAPYAVYYINKIRVNRDEFEPILRRTACFENVATYNTFLKQVSTCSLKIHGLLDTGIDIQVKNPLKGESILMKLELVRKNKRQHLKIGNKAFLIKNTPRIVNLPNKEYLDDIIDVLLNPENIEGITPEDLQELVILARKAYTDAIEKSKQLLENTIEKFKLEKTTLDLKGGRKSGYIVPGKIKTYFVSYENNKHTSDCGVYTYPDMQYVCIVDKTPNQQVGVDKFVNRIYALVNDQLLAKQISTLYSNIN